MPSILTLLPFVLMLGAIALMPLVASAFWEHNRHKLLTATMIALPVVAWLLWSGLGGELTHTLLYDYVPFIVLMTALFVITGGIFMDGDIEATPTVNTSFLALGAVLASLMGTTGAAMLLIRPLLHTNKERGRKVHTALFFIAIVANCGGLLTPLGDPPLFMLYLRGVPFEWFFGSWKIWAFVNGALLLIYFAMDTYHHRRETREALAADERNIKPIRIDGAWNLLWLLGVMLAVAFLNGNYFPAIATQHWLGFMREVVILACAGGAWITTKHITRVANGFSWHPIEEVAYLFFGIFVTMVPCVLYLKANAASFGITSPVAFYYLTGLLSSLLDNAPTAMAFHSLASSLPPSGLLPASVSAFGGTHDAVQTLIAGAPQALVRAIACAAVLFGSMTYIGNGPNLLVKSIAENNGVAMPHFFGYVLRFSLVILLPIFLLAQLLFIW